MDSRKWVKRFSIDVKLVYSNSIATQTNYLSQVTKFLFDFKNEVEPKSIPTEKIKLWVLEAKTINSRKHRICAIKAFYKNTVGMPDKIDSIPYPQKEKRLPIIIDQSDVQKLFNACDNLKHKAIMGVLYGTGVRISELLTIKLSDIKFDKENNKGSISVIGKGNKQRLVPLNEKLYSLLQRYWTKYRTKNWLFENDSTHLQYTKRSVQEFLSDLKIKARITSPVTPHKFRHSNATSLLEQGTDITIIQKQLGHNNIRTTQIYTHISKTLIENINSPINNIQL